MDLIDKYFPDIDAGSRGKLERLEEIYPLLNERVNVISRKDIVHLEERHILHSLSIAKMVEFRNDTVVLDLGTGGGFPGIPLAIMFPECRFVLVDSIGKKINVVKTVVEQLGLENVEAINGRAEDLKMVFDFVVSRAVTDMRVIRKWISGKVSKENRNDIANGLIYLKGGDVEDDLRVFKNKISIYPVKDFFEEEYFGTKYIVHLRYF